MSRSDARMTEAKFSEWQRKRGFDRVFPVVHEYEDGMGKIQREQFHSQAITCPCHPTREILWDDDAKRHFVLYRHKIISMPREDDMPDWIKVKRVPESELNKRSISVDDAESYMRNDLCREADRVGARIVRGFHLLARIGDGND